MDASLQVLDGPLTGRLSGSGTDMMHAIVRTAAVPDRPPADLADQVVAVRDENGQVVDWHLGGPNADGARFSRWRGGFLTERVIGERALIAGFLDWADHHCDISALRILRLPSARVEPATAIRMRWQLAQAATRCRVLHEHGLGISTPANGATLIRGVVPAPAPVELLTWHGHSVYAAADHLQIRVPGSDPVEVIGWLLEGDGLVAQSRAGSRLVPDAVTARLLRAVGRGYPEVTLAPVALDHLLAPLFVFLADMTLVAEHSHAALQVRCGAG